MAKILFTYEFGAGLGHINRLSAVAKLLDPRHKLVFAVPNVKDGKEALEKVLDASVEVIQGYNWSPLPSSNPGKAPTDTFADAICLYGYDQLERLLTASMRWLDVLARSSPDLIVADWAPTLRLVSQPRIPTVIVGNGYTVPPAGRPLLPIRPWSDTVPPRSRAHEGQLLTNVNEVRERLAGPAIDFFSDLFHGDRTFVCTLPEFDPYARARQEPSTWPFNVPTHMRDPDSEPRNAVFCYLQGSHPSLKQALAAINQLTQGSEIYIRGADARRIARQSSRKSRIRVRPADFATSLPASRVLFHHGGLGTAYAGLAAGIPQIIIPLQLEHHVTARGLDRFGCCRHFAKEVTTATLKSAIEEMMADPKYASSALAAKKELEARRAPDPAAAVVEACEALL